MDILIIEGNGPLNGVVPISGSKNAALPILIASLLMEGPVYYTNVPRLRDIGTTLKLLEVLGCPAEMDEDGNVTAHPCEVAYQAPYELVRTMRASALCLGPLLARLGRASVALPGGCAIGARPVDMHLTALEKMGATFNLDAGYIEGTTEGLKGAHIAFPFPTVGGTENLLMAASLADGTTVLENAAREPEVCDLAEFLIQCGARITGHGTSEITIE
ncbi:MAG: UDP-N-acetylglucosamine 1-carboxyvinyltransferase, partial [Oceanidesulfovibrio sp.]